MLLLLLTSEKRNWLLPAAASGLGAVIVALLLWLLPAYAALALGIGVAVFLVVLWLNPAYVYRRMGFFVFTVWTGVSSAGAFGFDLVLPQVGELKITLDGAHWVFHLVTLVMVCVLFGLDFLQTNGVYRRTLEVAKTLQESPPESETERERLIRSIGEPMSRERLVLAAIQAEAEFITVEANQLTKEQQTEIAIRQIEAREAAKVADAEFPSVSTHGLTDQQRKQVLIRQIEARERVLLVRERRWWIIAVASVVAVVVIGSVASVLFASNAPDPVGDVTEQLVSNHSLRQGQAWSSPAGDFSVIFLNFSGGTAAFSTNPAFDTDSPQPPGVLQNVLVVGARFQRRVGAALYTVTLTHRTENNADTAQNYVWIDVTRNTGLNE